MQEMSLDGVVAPDETSGTGYFFHIDSSWLCHW